VRERCRPAQHALAARRSRSSPDDAKATLVQAVRGGPSQRCAGLIGVVAHQYSLRPVEYHLPPGIFAASAEAWLP